jgi:hypothetical protein
MAKGTGDKDTAASGCGKQAESRTVATKGRAVRRTVEFFITAMA